MMVSAKDVKKFLSNIMSKIYESEEDFILDVIGSSQLDYSIEIIQFDSEFVYIGLSNDIEYFYTIERIESWINEMKGVS